MFGRKRIEERLEAQDKKIRELKSIVQDLCPHNDIYVRVQSFFDGFEIYRVTCQKCDETIKIVDKKQSIQIMKDQELRQAKELIAKSEQEEKENKDA